MTGWEVEGFVDRLTRRDDTNSERLVLEAVSHLRAFSRDCDALRAEIERLRAALRSVAAEADGGRLSANDDELRDWREMSEKL